MRLDVHNWGELVDAVDEMRRLPVDEPRVLVFFDPGGVTHHYGFGQHGMTKLSSDRRGEPYPELSQRENYKPRGL